MIRIAITPEAFDAICATLPKGGVAFEHDRDKQGRVLVWLVDQLDPLRRPTESLQFAFAASAEPRQLRSGLHEPSLAHAMPGFHTMSE